MQFAKLIERIKSTPYFYSGFYGLSSPPFEQVPLRVNFEFLHDDDSIVIRGTIQTHAHEKPEMFEVTIPFRTMSVNSAWASLSAPATGALEGRVVSVGENFEFLAASSEGRICSAHLVFTGPNRFVVSGMLTTGQHSIAFDLMDDNDWQHAKAAKKISMAR